MMDRNGQVGIIGVVFLFVVFLILWFVWLGGYVAEMGHSVVVSYGITGIEAFFFENLNIFIMIAAALGVLAFMYFGGGRE